MNGVPSKLRLLSLLAMFGSLALALAQVPDEPMEGEDGPPEGFDGPGFGPGGPSFGGGPGGPGGVPEITKLVKQFDKDGDGRLNTEERRAAMTFLNTQTGGRGMRGPGGPPGGPGGPGGRGGRGGNRTAAQPGPKLSPADVKSFPGAPLYDELTVRTLFLEFADADWEKQLMAFHRTDVEVPATLTVDGRTYREVGMHFHGMSSFMMVGEGQKHSMVLSLDSVHPDQQLGGYHKLNLLNSHEDASFLRTVLSLQMARDYLPAPKANFVRVVINGECWGIYVNQQHFNKDFVKQWFGSTKGARWKVPGSPGGQGGMNYLGEEVAPYKRIYAIKSTDDPAPWADLIKLCKVLNETPADKLEQTLAPLLDVEGALKFFAWENVLASGDGFYSRASDYDLYEDKTGRFHIIPYDANETFSMGEGGPGGPPGGPGARGGPPGVGRGGFGPGMFIAGQLLAQADKNGDQKLTREEFTALADAWFDQLDPDKTNRVSQEQFVAKFTVLLFPTGLPDTGFPGGGPPRAGGPGGFGPERFLGVAFFTAMDANKDGALTRTELKEGFARWFAEWDAGKDGFLDEAELRTGLNAALPRPNFGGPGGPPGMRGMGGPGGGRGRGGPGGMGGPGGPGGPGGGGTQLDPLVTANDTEKPLLSKLLAVPSLRTHYLGYVRDMAEKWLGWNKLGPLAEEYHALIVDDVKADTRKLDSTEDFLNSVAPVAQKMTGGEGATLKDFAEKRRAFLLNHAAIKKAAN